MLFSSISEYFSSLTGAEILYYVVIVCIIPLTVIGMFASGKVNSIFHKYNQVSSKIGMTAAEAAQQMLKDNQLFDVSVVKTSGNLTDHYDPRSNTIALSESVHSSTSVGAIAVACHEAGHAIQHANKYVFSTLRSFMVPVLNFTNRLFFPILLVGMLLGFASPYTFIGTILVTIGCVLFGLSALFALITLPTEFNASSRALKGLEANGYLSGGEVAGARKVLNAAAMTYVISFLLSLVQFLRFFALLLMSKNRD